MDSAFLECESGPAPTNWIPDPNPVKVRLPYSFITLFKQNVQILILFEIEN